MASVSRKILMNLDMMLLIFSVAWHWMLKTCIQLSITRVGPLQLSVQYARDFGSTAKKSLKRTTAWSAYYYTSRGSWYSVPERSLGLFEIPSMSQTLVVKVSKDEISMMREWARAHGSSVRQRSYHGKCCNSARLFVPKGDQSWRKNRSFFKELCNHRHQLRIQHHWCRRRKRGTRTRTDTSITRDLPIKISTSLICLTRE